MAAVQKNEPYSHSWRGLPPEKSRPALGSISGRPLKGGVSNAETASGRSWGCKPKPPKIPSSQIQPRQDRIQVYGLPRPAESVVPV